MSRREVMFLQKKGWEKGRGEKAERLIKGMRQ